MPKKDSILNLPGFTIKKSSGFNPVIIETSYRRIVRCPHCASKKLRKKDKFIRYVKHESIGIRRTILKIEAYKFYCKSCHKYFNQRFPGIVKYQRSTEKLRKQVFHQHTQGISQKDLAHDLELGKSTVERWYKHYYFIKNQHLKQSHCPRVLGIDEHFFSKKQGYATTLCDLRSNKIFDVVKGRYANDLKKYLDALPGKDKVRVVCMDLSNSYRSLVRNYFPNAKIVADRFHVIRLLAHYCLKTCHSIDPNIKYQRGILAILRTKPEKLSSKQLQQRDDYFKQQPAIEAIYQFKQRMHTLLMHKECKAKKCRELIPMFLDMIKQLKQTAFSQLVKLGKTLYNWREEIVRMWRFSKNNGITEGFHRKMKLI